MKINFWTSIKLEELNELIFNGVEKMSKNEKIFWDLIKIIPEKWNGYYFEEKKFNNFVISWNNQIGYNCNYK